MRHFKLNALLAFVFLIVAASLSIAEHVESENDYTPVQWRDIKQGEFDRADAVYNQASSEAEKAREVYSEKLKAKGEASAERSKALSALNIAKTRVGDLRFINECLVCINRGFPGGTGFQEPGPADSAGCAEQWPTAAKF